MTKVGTIVSDNLSKDDLVQVILDLYGEEFYRDLNWSLETRLLVDYLCYKCLNDNKVEDLVRAVKIYCPDCEPLILEAIDEIKKPNNVYLVVDYSKSGTFTKDDRKALDDRLQKDFPIKKEESKNESSTYSIDKKDLFMLLTSIKLLANFLSDNYNITLRFKTLLDRGGFWSLPLLGRFQYVVYSVIIMTVFCSTWIYNPYQLYQFLIGNYVPSTEVNPNERLVINFDYLDSSYIITRDCNQVTGYMEIVNTSTVIPSDSWYVFWDIDKDDANIIHISSFSNPYSSAENSKTLVTYLGEGNIFCVPEGNYSIEIGYDNINSFASVYHLVLYYGKTD